LGAEALDLETLPQCSEQEMAHPNCLLRPIDKRAPLRWVRGFSLQDGRLVWIPAVMVYLHIPYLSPGERIWLPISTGCAAHTTVEQALIGAICEVLERDAISLTWLQRLPLPRLELDAVPDWLEQYIQQNERARQSVEHLFFDATTDLGVPTIYSVQFSPRDEMLATLVMCSTELDPAIAAAKVMRESASSRIAMHTPHVTPDKWDDFLHVFDGATYMGHPDRMPAFDFLVNSPNRRRLSEMQAIGTGDTRQDLVNLLARLRQRNMDVFAVDISTDEALRVGMRIVRVLIPALQPLSFSYRARYLAHPRLYDAPRRMGYPVHSEAEINPWPQPFA
jgi:ribosomal protein S12 methylthiotransferase accessory factor